MATIGLKNIHVAPLLTDTEDASTYDVVTKLAAAISASIAVTNNSATLYGDDMLIAVEDSTGAITITIGVEDLTDEQYDLLMGTTKNSDGVIEDSTNDIAPYLALGFELPLREGGRRLYWYYKGRFQKPGGEHTTKGETITFGTETIVATFMPRKDTKWRSRIQVPGGETSTVADSWFDQVYAPIPTP